MVTIGWCVISFAVGLGGAFALAQITRESVVAPVATPSAAFMAEFRRGLEHFRAERFPDALEAFQAAARLDPDAAEAHHYVGEVYRKMVLMDKAEESFRRALAVDPGFGKSGRSLAMILHELGRYDDALELLERLRRDAPNDSFILGEIAINEIALGHPEEAIPLLERYNQLEGQQAWGLTHLGQAHDKAGHAGRAEELYRRSLEVDPYFALTHYWLGQLLSATNRKEESDKVLLTYRRLREVQTQEHQLGMALLRNPDDVSTLVKLARARFFLGKKKESLAALERARSLAPNDPNIEKYYRTVIESLGPGGGAPPPPGAPR